MVERARRRRGEVPRDCRPERALGSRLSRFGRVHELSTHERPQRVTDDLASQRGLGALDFLDSIKKAGAVRTLESLARIELGAQGGALWNGSRRPAHLRAVSLLLRCGNGSPHQTGMPMAGLDWSRRTELVLLDVHRGEVVLEDAGWGCPAECSVGSVVIVEMHEPGVGAGPLGF